MSWHLDACTHKVGMCLSQILPERLLARPSVDLQRLQEMPDHSKGVNPLVMYSIKPGSACKLLQTTGRPIYL